MDSAKVATTGVEDAERMMGRHGLRVITFIIPLNHPSART